MREFCTSGSVGGMGRKARFYPALPLAALRRDRSAARMIKVEERGHSSEESVRTFQIDFFLEISQK